MQIFTWDHGPHVASLRVTPNIDSFGDRSIPNVKNLIFVYVQAKVALRPTIPTPCVPTYFIADSYMGRWAARSNIMAYPKHSIVLDIDR